MKALFPALLALAAVLPTEAKIEGALASGGFTAFNRYQACAAECRHQFEDFDRCYQECLSR